MNGVDILGELAGSPEGTFLQTLPFNGNHFGACDITGSSPVWEMHPDTDEYFHVLEGEMEIFLLTDSGEDLHRIAAGSSFVVPRGLWHKPAAPNGAKFIFYTPGQSLHSEAADPRK